MFVARRGAILGLLMIAVIGSGCVRRRLTVRTSPPGAMVYVDRQPLGSTPVSHSFTYYGTRHFEIVRDGYRTETFLRTFRPPWYEIPPLSFVSETLWPFELRDHRIVDVQMVPDTVVPTDALINSAEGLRLQASQGLAVAPPPGGVLPSGPPTSGYPIPPLDQTYIDPTLPGNGGNIAPNPINPNVTNPPPNGFGLPQLLTPPTSIPSLNITPGGSYRPSTPER